MSDSCNPMDCSPPGSSVHGSRLPWPPPGNLPYPRIKPEFLASPALAGGFLPLNLLTFRSPVLKASLSQIMTPIEAANLPRHPWPPISDLQTGKSLSPSMWSEQRCRGGCGVKNKAARLPQPEAGSPGGSSGEGETLRHEHILWATSSFCFFSYFFNYIFTFSYHVTINIFKHTESWTAVYPLPLLCNEHFIQRIESKFIFTVISPVNQNLLNT